MRQRTPRLRDNSHLAFVRELPCVVCKDDTATEAAHIRFSDASAGKANPGVGDKPHDYWTVPLCGKCHRFQHQISEKAFWQLALIDPIRVALCLYVNSGDHETGTQIVQEARSATTAGRVER